jgi:hypothetical protein
MPIPWVNDFINALPPFNFVYITKSKVHSHVLLKEVDDDQENVPFFNSHSCNKLGANSICAFKNGGHYAYIKCGHLRSQFLSKIYFDFKK